ncbi:MAG: UDP-2,4-diacetamido-2,4,6-trideoxy-beta-L-altropyranose hydrolase [Anaerolineae bacterium]|nr:UDP-2,4-diacetamido-2,4,6-trideoxy-beta-L-altropyranose hydrolase [Anaerolineae bacterium]
MTAGTKRLVIRADANTRIGSGHVMRCLALAQAWQDAGGSVSFVMAAANTALADRLTSEGMAWVNLPVEPGSVEDATQTANLAHEQKALWVVVDGYHFLAGYQRIIKESGLKLLYLDDYGHAHHYYADVVLNQNIYAHEGLYAHREASTQLLLGTPYILLRREFTQWRNWAREISQTGRKILVTLGGADPENVTLAVVQALEKVPIENLAAVVVIGANNPHEAELRSALNCSSLSICLRKDVLNMPELMAWADIAIAAAGSTAWELAFMGLPSLLLVLADNQHPVAKCLDARKIAIHLDGHNLSDQISQAAQQLSAVRVRQSMSQLGRDLVDGEGCQRVLRQLKNLT